jgi:hypothetical protein
MLVTSTKENKPVRMPFLLTLGIVGAASCTTVTGPPARDAVHNFRIVLDQPVYTQGEASEFGIKATVTNTSRDRDFYANVGDGFNAALEQPTIYAARGTHAVIERRVSAVVWKNANAGILDEGSRFVVLRAGSSYRLAGSIAPDAPGTYRIRLDYFARNNDPSATPFHDYSATFRVR